jgi:hypothetical protein
MTWIDWSNQLEKVSRTTKQSKWARSRDIDPHYFATQDRVVKILKRTGFRATSTLTGHACKAAEFKKESSIPITTGQAHGQKGSTATHCR